jgi:hypothetical protein
MTLQEEQRVLNIWQVAANFPILQTVLFAVFLSRIRIQNRIRIHRIHMFLGLSDPNPDPLVRCMDPDPDPSFIKQKK